LTTPKHRQSLTLQSKLTAPSSRKTKASSCPSCNGEGSSYKKRKDGTLYKKANKCKECDARGYILTETNAVAGLAFNAPSKAWVSANGFSTGKDNLDVSDSYC
jgi:DnaJ-class molecular chaperone